MASTGVFFSCRTIPSADRNAGYYPYDVVCVNSELDGTITVKAYGMGGNRRDAIEQAEKNAVHTVLFKGIRSGTNDCNQAPLIGSPNVRKQHAAFFNEFFSDRTKPYAAYVSRRKDVRWNLPLHTKAAGSQIVYELILRIYTDKLYQEMQNNGIIN